MARTRVSRSGEWADVVGSMTAPPARAENATAGPPSAASVDPAARHPGLRGRAGGDRLALHGLAAHDAAQRQPAGDQLDAVAAQTAADRLPAERTGQLLEGLGERERRGPAIAHLRRPGAGGAARDHPEGQAGVAPPRPPRPPAGRVPV